jgi:hypothetical protein
MVCKEVPYSCAAVLLEAEMFYQAFLRTGG